MLLVYSSVSVLYTLYTLKNSKIIVQIGNVNNKPTILLINPTSELIPNIFSRYSFSIHPSYEKC